MSTTKQQPIGELKTKVKKYCTICGCPSSRTLTLKFYDNSPEAIESAKAELTLRANKEYTCKICNSIVNGVN